MDVSIPGLAPRMDDVWVPDVSAARDLAMEAHTHSDSRSPACCSRLGPTEWSVTADGGLRRCTLPRLTLTVGSSAQLRHGRPTSLPIPGRRRGNLLGTPREPSNNGDHSIGRDEAGRNPVVRKAERP